MTEIKPLPCWCGNMPEFRPGEHNEYGCFNHPTKNPRLKAITNLVRRNQNVVFRQMTEEELIVKWNEKVTRHNESERKKSQECVCGKHYIDSWTYCPFCGRELNSGAE